MVTARDIDAPTFQPDRSINAVAFEYEMAVEAASRAEPIRKSQDYDEFIAAIAFIESFLVHARCLDEFLSSRGRHPTDVRASDFVAGFSESPLPDHVRDSINWALHHITVYRQDGHIPWLPIEILRPIVESMGRFIEALTMVVPYIAARLRRVHDLARRLV